MQDTPFNLLRSTVKRWLVGRAVVGFSRLARAIPASLASRIGSWIGDVVYRGSARYRTVALANLRQAFHEDWSEERILRTAKETFRNFGKSAIEFLRLPGLSDEDIRRLARYEGSEHLDEALSRGKGCLLVTAHFGNWEMMASRIALDYPLSVISRDADDPATNQMINGIREHRGYKVLSRNQSLKQTIMAFRRNEVVGILPDQNVAVQGIFVPFFGKLAATATGTAALARSTGTAVVPCFSVRQPDDTFKIIFKPSLKFDFTEDKEADIRRATLVVNQTVEEAIRNHPSQWLWIHDRWKRRPIEEKAAAEREVTA